MGTTWIEHDSGLCWEQSDLLRRAGVCHGVTGRSGGVSTGRYESLNLSLQAGDDVLNVLENRRRLCLAIGADLNNVTACRQADGDHIVAVGPAEAGCGAGSSGTALAHADAMMTDCAGLPLLVLVADNVPVIVYDPAHHACAVGQAGLLGTTRRLAAKIVLAMELAYGSRPDDLCAYIGPCAGAGHVEVSKSSARAVELMGRDYARCVRHSGSRTVDLRQATYRLFIDAGLQPEHIDISQSCTFEDEKNFFSYRRDFGYTGRMAAFAVLSEAAGKYK